MSILHTVQSVAIGVEPFNEPQDQLDNSANILNWFGDKLEVAHIIAIVNPVDLAWPGDIVDDAWAREVQKRALNDLEKRFRVSESKCTFHFDVLIIKSSSRSMAVAQFLKFATEKKVDLIIVHSHTKSDLLASLGSFCGQLVSSSEIPLLVIPKNGHLRFPLQSILFPTDFSGLSKIAFQTVVPWARGLSAAIQLYHRVARPIDIVLEIALHPMRGKTVMPNDCITLNDTAVEKRAADWASWALAEGCVVNFCRDSEKLSLPGSIVARSEKERVQMIALPTRTSEVNVVSIGSAVCHILRASLVPVLVLPYRYISPGSFPDLK